MASVQGLGFRGHPNTCVLNVMHMLNVACDVPCQPCGLFTSSARHQHCMLKTAPKFAPCIATILSWRWEGYWAIDRTTSCPPLAREPVKLGPSHHPRGWGHPVLRESGSVVVCHRAPLSCRCLGQCLPCGAPTKQAAATLPSLCSL